MGTDYRSVDERPIELALVDVPLSALAGVTHTEPKILIGKFESHRVSATDQQSIREIAINSGVGENRLLEIVLLSK